MSAPSSTATSMWTTLPPLRCGRKSTLPPSLTSTRPRDPVEAKKVVPLGNNRFVGAEGIHKDLINEALNDPKAMIPTAKYQELMPKIAEAGD